jgi:hypothetical protein
LLAALLAALALGASATVSPAAAAHGTLSAVALGQQVSTLVGEATGEWRAHEQSDGWLVDPVQGPLDGTYGVGMVGQATVEAGVAAGDQTAVEAGLRAELAELAHPDDGGFELLSFAQAYAWNQTHLPGTQAWATAGPRIAAFLRAHRSPIGDASACYGAAGCYDNLKLVNAVAYLALLPTGLIGATNGALLDDRAGLRAQALALLAMAARNTSDDAQRLGTVAFGDAGILSDPTENPLAYEALSAEMLGHAVLALGTAVPHPVLEAFSRAARGLIGLIAPAGDVAYIGRGQGQVWTAGAAADAFAIAAALTPSAVWRGRYLAGVALVLRRLRTVYPRGGWGFPLVPRLAGDPDGENYLGLDGYANTVEYNGLTLWALADAAPVLDHLASAPAQPIPSETDGVFIDPSHARFVAITHGNWWLAVHGTDSNFADARYGFGLVAAEVRTAHGWQPSLARRPLTNAPQVGGLAMLTGGHTYYPVGTALDTSVSDRTTIDGHWETSQGARQSGTARWSYWVNEAGNGVTLTFDAHRRDTYLFQVWYPQGARVSRGTKSITVSELGGASQTYRLSMPFRLSPSHTTYHSAYAEKLASSILTVVPGRTGKLEYTTILQGR